jgi:hypothetical protein
VVQAAPPARNRRRRRNRGNGGAFIGPMERPAQMGGPLVQYSPTQYALQNPLMPQALGVSNGRNNMSTVAMPRDMRRGKVSPVGEKFLKCAFSAADFDGSGTYGVPDSFGGKSVAVKHRNVNPTVFAALTDIYIIVAPVPGYSYFYTLTPQGVPPTSTAVFQGVPYSDLASIFANPNTTLSDAQSVLKFRFVSQHFEIVPTTNQTSWTGSITAFKIQLQATSESTAALSNRMTLTGLSGILANNADQYNGPFNLGVYTGAYNRSAAWEFTPTINGMNTIPQTVIAGYDWGSLTYDGIAGHALPGFDNNMESICIKIAGIGSNPADSCLIKTWACVEYQFSPGTMMYEMQNLHFAEDRMAMELYKYIVQGLPVGVSFIDNANFWQRVLGIIKQVSGGLSLLPGPYGMMAGGVNAISSGLELLTM